MESRVCTFQREGHALGRKYFLKTYKLLPSLSSNGKNDAPQQTQSCHLQVSLLSA